MIKKSENNILFVSSVLFIIVLSLSFISAGACSLTTNLINQDPYPAIPGDYVKLVFEVSGVDNPECGEVQIKFIGEFPLTLDTGAQSVYSTSSFYERDYHSTLVAPYKVRVDKEAIDGENSVDVVISSKSSSGILNKFNVTIEDKRVDFEVHIKDYNPTTNILTLEILNIGKYDIKALSVEVPKQDSLFVKGANKNIVGDLDSNEYTTADFEATPQNGVINLILAYSDGINVRRTVEKSVVFDSSYFDDRKANEKATPVYVYILVLIVIVVAFIFYRRHRKKKAKRSE